MSRESIAEDDFIAGFENASLPAHSFHHRDHVKAAFLYVSRYPALEAMARFSSALARFAAANGKPGLYNETITWAYLLLIRERMARAGARQNWTQFEAANADLLSWENNILGKYYRKETLASELAKKVFLFPDKIATGG